ncbi:hypothetical protein ACQ86G_15825 [Roseateles chitinivorans]|uniref:hypothetical protein n=1 Tax=Roseateles chitinivorans TaxID=2917965 RepID=UPI003D67190C
MVPISEQRLDWSVLRYGLANRTQLIDPVDKDAVTAFAETSLAALSPGDAGF